MIAGGVKGRGGGATPKSFKTKKVFKNRWEGRIIDKRRWGYAYFEDKC